MAADPKYTVFIRLPIPRGDFVDPPPVDWDSSKDEALWKILSGAAQTEIDWNQVAEHFDVHVDFLLKQVAYLTDRHASQVRAQVRKATAAAKGSSAGPSPTPTASDTPVPSLHQRTPSALSRRDSPIPKSDDGGGNTPLNRSARPNVSRNTSTNTSILREKGEVVSSLPRLGKVRPVEQSARKRLSSLPITSPVAKSPELPSEPMRSPSPGPAEPSSSSSSDDDSLPAQSRIIRRPPRFQQKEQGRTYDDDDDDDESEPAFQPYRAAADQSAAQDLASTLRGDNKSGSRKAARKDATNQSQTSDSSVGSAAQLQRQGKRREQRPPQGPLSPRRTAELSGKSPSGKSRGYSREGSDGTPSMGSSFSDLDDASVTQSALEEALASHMNRGGGSRFSISQAFRSRHTPNPNK